MTCRCQLSIGAVALFLAGCSAQQLAVAATDQAMVQAVLDAACTNNLIEADLATIVPQLTIACVAGVVGADVVTAVLAHPQAVLAVEALVTKYRIPL